MFYSLYIELYIHLLYKPVCVCVTLGLQAICEEVQRVPAGDWTLRADNARAGPGVPPRLL